MYVYSIPGGFFTEVFELQVCFHRFLSLTVYIAIPFKCIP